MNHRNITQTKHKRDASTSVCILHCTIQDFYPNYFTIDHCVEHFREGSMCHEDISLTVFFYRPNAQVNAKLLAEHEYVNWNNYRGLGSAEKDQFDSDHFCATFD